MVPIIVILHVCICVALILIVLLQKGKGAGMGAAFGGSSQTVFGSAGATTLLHKLTTAVAVVFMLTSLGLSLLFSQGTTSSIMEDVTPVQAPAAKTDAPASGDKTEAGP
ncbi:MAG: preprotein translocase subunit SecG [Desulfococcus sp. 4484_242]|nr:MAG: preprotein translocase subunit SecG [Desulfococcus sp. 4484_242]